MQSVVEINRLKPIGTKIIVTKGAEVDKIKGFIVPEEYRIDRNAHIYEGVVIAVGDRTKSARYGHTRDWFEPGDKVYFWAMWEWNDKDVVLRDEKTSGEYLVLDESDVKAYELMGDK